MCCVKFIQHVTKFLHTTCEILAEPFVKAEIKKEF